MITSEEPVPGTSTNTTSLPDHDYNIYRVNKKTKVIPNSDDNEALGRCNQDEQMEAVAQSVAAAAQEKEKQKRKRGAQAVLSFFLSDVSISPIRLKCFFLLYLCFVATRKRYSTAQFHAGRDDQAEQSCRQE